VISVNVVVGSEATVMGRFKSNVYFQDYYFTYILYNMILQELKWLCSAGQIFTNFDNFWHKDDKEAKIMRDALIFHLT